MLHNKTLRDYDAVRISPLILKGLKPRQTQSLLTNPFRRFPPCFRDINKSLVGLPLRLKSPAETRILNRSLHTHTSIFSYH